MKTQLKIQMDQAMNLQNGFSYSSNIVTSIQKWHFLFIFLNIIQVMTLVILLFYLLKNFYDMFIVRVHLHQK